MKQLEKLEKYVITPNVRFYGGFKYDGEDIFLCDDKIDEKNFNCSKRFKNWWNRKIINIVNKLFNRT